MISSTGVIDSTGAWGYSHQIYYSFSASASLLEFDRELRYCTGEVCHSSKELFNPLLSDYQSYMEVELTQGRRELTEDDEKQIRVLCKKYVDRLPEELMK